MIDINIKKKIRTYNGYNPLQVNHSFASGKVTQVLGLSGAGKTTFLKILAGLTRCEEGKIIVDEQTWLDTSTGIFLEPQQRKVGFVFQDYALFPNMTVEKHLLYGTPDTKYIKRLLALGRMDAFIHHKPRQLSGGQQQRLAILRALSTRPNLLLMDEPFSALDTALRSNIISDLKVLLSELAITTLVVTHQPFTSSEFAEDSFEVV